MHAREEPEPGRLANADLKTLYDEVCAAAGFHPRATTAIDRAMGQVEEWRNAGMDFEAVVLPSIRAELLATDQPTRVLGRFNPRVTLEHAKHKATAKKGQPYGKPEIPKLNPEGEDPGFLPLRTDLLEQLGPHGYALVFNRMTFEDPGPCQGDKHPLKVSGSDSAVDSVRHGRYAQLLLRTAQSHGFTDVW